MNIEEIIKEREATAEMVSILNSKLTQLDELIRNGENFKDEVVEAILANVAEKNTDIATRIDGGKIIAPINPIEEIIN